VDSTSLTPQQVLAEVRESHARLHRTVANLNDDEVLRASLLPAWTVGHVLTHLARNADSVVRRLVAAAQGEVVDQYPRGTREAEIDHGAARSARETLTDLRRSDEALEALVVDEETWSRPVRRGNGPDARLVPAWMLAWSRWREVEVHHVDLGLGYRPDGWPGPLVDWMLPRLLEGLARRTEPSHLVAWAMDRGAAPGLAPWDS
jgi:maleylpyruvate isomerase